MPPVTTNAEITPELARRASVEEAERNYEKKVKGWKTMVKSAQTREVFPYKQFLWRDTDSDYGTDWQQTICEKADIPEEHWERFWKSSGGNKVAKQSMIKKRANTGNQMKKEFFSRS